MDDRPAILDTEDDFITPEHIAFRFRMAGPAPRAVAWLIDFMIRVAIIVGAGLSLTSLFGGLGVGLLLVLYFICNWLAGAFCEWLWGGFTPGKRLLGIRVVSTDGLPAGLGACLLRNLLRAADWLPFGFAFGLVTMACNRRFQRLGDLAADTVVVYHQPARAIGLQRFDNPRLFERCHLLPGDLDAQLDSDAKRAIASFCERRLRFSKARRNEIAAHLTEPLRARFGLDDSWHPDELLCAIYVRLYQDDAEGGSARAAAIIASRRRDWQQLQTLSADPSRDDGLRLSRLYRSACADLALTHSYSLPVRQQRFLHNLVSRAHLAFYRRLMVDWSRLVRMLLIEVPGRLYADPCLHISFLAFFGVFALAALLGWYSQDLAVDFIGEEMANQYREMYCEAGFNHRSFGTSGFMSGWYINNNVGIAMACFASGIFLGVGSLVYMVFNGLYLGLVFGFMIEQDPATTANFYEFVTAHGPFELSGIMLSGAAGLRLGLGLVDRQGLPWRESLALAARRALPIVIVGGIAIALAAPIEGFISPSDLPLWFKRGVAVLSALILLLYLVVLGRRAQGLLRAEGEAVA